MSHRLVDDGDVVFQRSLSLTRHGLDRANLFIVAEIIKRLNPLENRCLRLP